MSTEKQVITVETLIPASIEKVWECLTQPRHIMNWNAASEDWHCPAAQNDLKPGGTFCYTMASRDGQMSFDFNGTFREIIPNQVLAYELEDGRKVRISLHQTEAGIRVKEDFEAEGMNPPELQKQGWQAILDNLNRYTTGS